MGTSSEPEPKGTAAEHHRTVAGAYHRSVGALNWVEAGLFKLFWFVPHKSILRDPRFQHVLVAESLDWLAITSIAFGAVVGTVRAGGTPFQSAVIGVAALLPAAFLGLWGGKVANALPKRLAIGGPYAIEGALCILVPWIIGIDFVTMLLLIFVVHCIAQVAWAAEPAILPLVSSEEQYATGVSMVNFGTSAGSGLASALVAPLLVVFFGVTVVFIVSGVLLLIAATRVLQVPSEKAWEKIDWSLRGAGPKTAMNWLLDHFAVCTMVLVAVLAGTSNKVMQNLAPSYVDEGLHTDPAESAYVFAPATIGMFLAMTLAPGLTHRFGERVAALLGFLSVAVGLTLLGLNSVVTPLIAPWNPLQVLQWLGADVSDDVLAAGLCTIPIGLGTTLTAIAVQTYINRHVAADRQAGTFSIQSTLVNWFAIGPLLILGGLATVIGVKPVMFIIPGVMVVSAAVLVGFSYRYTGRGKAPSGMRMLHAFLHEPEPSGRP